MPFKIGDVITFRRPGTWVPVRTLRVKHVHDCADCWCSKRGPKYCGHCDHNIYNGTVLDIKQRLRNNSYLNGYLVRKAIPIEEARYKIFTRVKKGDLIEYQDETTMKVGKVLSRRWGRVYITSVKQGAPGRLQSIRIDQITKRFLRADKKYRILVEQL